MGKYVVMPYYSSATASGIAMSYKVFNKLPADIQTIIRQLQLDPIDRYAADLFNLEENVMKKWKQMGYQQGKPGHISGIHMSVTESKVVCLTYNLMEEKTWRVTIKRI